MIVRGYLACLVFFAAGCTHLQLKRSTLHQARTLTEIHYQQILDNLAMLARNPGALPFFATVGQGIAQITDNGSTTDAVIPNALPGGIYSGNYNVMASRNVQENWTIIPIIDPDKLRRMRCAYHFVLGVPESDCDDCQAKLQDFFCPDACKKNNSGVCIDPLQCEHCLECALPHGWFAVGDKKHVPKKACYVGHYCNTYVWVLPGGMDGLTRLTLSILDLATVASHVETAQVKRLYNNAGRLLQTEVLTTEATPVSTKAEEPRRLAPKPRLIPQFLSSYVPAVPHP